MIRFTLLLCAVFLFAGCAAWPPPAGLNRDGSPVSAPGRAQIRQGVWVDLSQPVPGRLDRCAPTASFAVADHDLGRPPLGACLDRGWTECWQEAHFSRSGAPFVHGFLTEPAFLGRDLYVDFAYANTSAQTEYELDVELEWALTRRLGFVAEVPFIWWEFEAQSDIYDVGDLGAGLRALLAESRSVLFSGGLDANFPTSDDGDGIGANEWTVTPYAAAWVDLGAWWTWQGRVGVEFLLSSNAETLTWSTMLAKSFRVPFLLPHGDPGHTKADHEHYGQAAFSAFVEVSGETALSGPNDGTTEGQFLVGFSQNVTDVVELRTGAFFPLTDETDIDWGFRMGCIVHL